MNGRMRENVSSLIEVERIGDSNSNTYLFYPILSHLHIQHCPMCIPVLSCIPTLPLCIYLSNPPYSAMTL